MDDYTLCTCGKMFYLAIFDYSVNDRQVGLNLYYGAAILIVSHSTYN